MWRGLRRTHLKARPRQRRGITFAELKRMLATLSCEKPHDVRDAAVAAGRLRNDAPPLGAGVLQIEQLTLKTDGSGSLLLERSRTD